MSPEATSQPIDEALFHRAASGDSRAFWELVSPFRRLVYSVAWGVLRDEERTEDVVQDTWVRAWTTLGTLQSPQKLSGWLYVMARNVAYEQVRQSDKQHRIAERNPEPIAAPIGDTLEADEQVLLMRVALSQLPEQHRVVIALKYLEGASCKDIADRLEIGVEAAKSRLFEARKLLRNRMESLEKHGWKHLLPRIEGRSPE
ncbi:sigma-70 family RNA polymerase sigma factor [bacterium]|nr:sigma-70 family RNA polymerase sigma factor [bacterium]